MTDELWTTPREFRWKETPSMTPLAKLPFDEGEIVESMAHCMLNASEEYGYMLFATSKGRLFVTFRR